MKGLRDNLYSVDGARAGDWLIHPEGWRRIKSLSRSKVGMGKRYKVRLLFHGNHEPIVINDREWSGCVILRLKEGDKTRSFSQFLYALIQHNTDYEWTPLHRVLDDIDIIRGLLSLQMMKGSLNTQMNVQCGSMKHAPLHLACADIENGNAELVKLLLAHGASPSMCNAYGETPLDIALNHQNWACAEILVARGSPSRLFRPWICEMRERWSARVALCYCIRQGYRLPMEIMRDIMSWV